MKSMKMTESSLPLPVYEVSLLIFSAIAQFCYGNRSIGTEFVDDDCSDW